MKIQTVNQLISVFKDISTRHYQINGFGIGDEWEIGASKAEMHPVLWINPVTATMPSTDNGYKTFEIDFEVRVFDLVSKGETNENDVLSDCIDILKDIITEFKGHPYYVNSQLNIIDDISFEAFTEEFDEEVSGWVCEISLMTPILNSFCGIPAADITGFEFPGTDCPEVNVLCPVFVEDVTGVYPIVVTTVGTTKEVSIVGGAGSDTYVISGVYDTGTLTLTRNDAVDVVVTGFASGGDNDYTTAATLSGNIITFDRTDTLGAYSVDLTSAINSAPDKFVSSGAYDEINNKIVLTLNDASTVDIDTSAIGGGDNIGNADLTLTGVRVFDLNSNDLSFENGETTLKSSSNFPLIVQNTQSATTGGQGALKILSNVSSSAVGGGAIIDVVSNGTLNTGRIHNYTFSNGDVGWRIYSWGGSGAIGNSYLAQNESTALIGENATSKIGSETISLQGDTLVHSSASFPLTVQNTQSATAGGQGALKILSNVASGAVGSGAIIDVVSNGSLNTGRIHNYTFGSGNVGWRIYSWGGSSSLGNSYLAQDKNAALIGKNVTSRVSTEDISLQGSTVIKGLGTSGSSALAIYDNDTTPVKVFEVLDDSTIKTNGTAGFTGTGVYTNFTIENGIITNAT